MAPQAFFHRNRTAVAADGESRLLEFLAAQGFQMGSAHVRVPVVGLRRGAECDAVVHRDGRQFAVICKTARLFAEWFFQWVARPILELQALRRLRGWDPILAVAVNTLDARSVRRLRAQLAFYAPELWWVLIDQAGNYALHLPGEDREHFASPPSIALRVGDVAQVRDTAHVALLPSPPHSAPSFGDLDQLLLKIWFLGPAPGQGWGGPAGSARTLMALARLAGVAPPLVYRWAAAMQRSGYLRKWRRIPLLQSGDALLPEWRGRYRLTDNTVIPCDPVFGAGAALHAEVLQRLREPAMQLPYAVTGHLACRVYGFTHSEARSVQLYVPDNWAAYLDALQLVASENPAAPVWLLTPRHSRSVWTGVKTVDGVAVCDVIQIYLDLYHLADRGREQAEFLYERVLGNVLRSAAEPRDAL